MVNRIVASGLIFEHVFNFSYMMSRLIASQKTTGDNQKSPKHQLSLEGEPATAEDISQGAVTALGKALSCEQDSVGLCMQTASCNAHPLLCASACWIDEMAQNPIFSATLWWFRFAPSIDTCFFLTGRTVSVLYSLLEVLLFFSCHELLHCIPGASGSKITLQ